MTLPADFDARARAVGFNALARRIPCHKNTLYQWRRGTYRPSDVDVARAVSALEELEAEHRAAMFGPFVELARRLGRDTWLAAGIAAGFTTEEAAR